MMVENDALERELWQQRIGEFRLQIQQLQQLVVEQKQQWEADAREWKRLQLHRQDLIGWLVDAATNETGQVIHPSIDAGLGGELFIPCTMTTTEKGRRYALSLASTRYEVTEVR